MTIRWPCWKHVYYVPGCWRCRARNDGPAATTDGIDK